MSVARVIPKRIRDQQDASMSPGSGTNGYAIVYNHTSGKFELGTFEASGAAAAAVAAHVGLSNPHSQYLLSSGVSAYGATLIDDADAATARTTLGLGTAATLNVGTGANQIVQLDSSARLPAVDGSQLTGVTAAAAGSTTQVIYNASGVYAGDAGMTYNATTDRLTVAGGLIAGDWSPPSDSTTAMSIWNAARSARVVTVDTTNGILIANKMQASAYRSAGVGAVGTIESDTYYEWQDPTGTILYFDFRNDGVPRFRKQSVMLAGLLSYNAIKTYGTISRPEANSPAFEPFTTEIRLRTYAASNKGLAFLAFAGQTAALTEWRNSSGQVISAVSGDGRFCIGQSSATALLDVGASSIASASMRVRAGTAPTTPNAGDIWDDGGLVAYNIDATTNAVVNSLKMRRGSSGTPAAGFGLGIAARLESTTTEDQDAGRLTYEWVTATHASRASRGKLSAYYTTTEQEAIRWDGDTAGLKLGFYGVAAVARQVLATGAGASVDDVITFLQNLGLAKQS